MTYQCSDIFEFRNEMFDVSYIYSTEKDSLPLFNPSDFNLDSIIRQNVSSALHRGYIVNFGIINSQLCIRSLLLYSKIDNAILFGKKPVKVNYKYFVGMDLYDGINIKIEHFTGYILIKNQNYWFDLKIEKGVVIDSEDVTYCRDLFSKLEQDKHNKYGSNLPDEFSISRHDEYLQMCYEYRPPLKEYLKHWFVRLESHNNLYPIVNIDLNNDYIVMEDDVKIYFDELIYSEKYNSERVQVKDEEELIQKKKSFFSKQKVSEPKYEWIKVFAGYYLKVKNFNLEITNLDQDFFVKHIMNKIEKYDGKSYPQDFEFGKKLLERSSKNDNNMDDDSHDEVNALESFVLDTFWRHILLYKYEIQNIESIAKDFDGNYRISKEEIEKMYNQAEINWRQETANDCLFILRTNDLISEAMISDQILMNLTSDELDYIHLGTIYKILVKAVCDKEANNQKVHDLDLYEKNIMKRCRDLVKKGDYTLFITKLMTTNDLN